LFYDLKQRVDEKYKTMQIEIERQDIKSITSNIEKNQRLILMHDYVNNTSQELNEINKIIREVSEGQMNPMSPQEKREQINFYKKKKEEILEQTIKFRESAGL
jgi:hypothetical protein